VYTYRVSYRQECLCVGRRCSRPCQFSSVPLTNDPISQGVLSTYHFQQFSFELRNVSFELRNVSFELRNVSFVRPPSERGTSGRHYPAQRSYTRGHGAVNNPQQLSTYVLYGDYCRVLLYTYRLPHCRQHSIAPAESLSLSALWTPQANQTSTSLSYLIPMQRVSYREGDLHSRTFPCQAGLANTVRRLTRRLGTPRSITVSPL
jgi:hypothetical protein